MRKQLYAYLSAMSTYSLDKRGDTLYVWIINRVPDPVGKARQMGLVKKFQQRDVAEAIELLLNMIRTVADGLQPHRSDIGRLVEIAAEIRASR